MYVVILFDVTDIVSFDTGSRDIAEKPYDTMNSSDSRKILSMESAFRYLEIELNTKTVGCLCSSLAQCALSLRRSAGPGFNPQTRQNL